MPNEASSLMAATIDPPNITIRHLEKTADREDFLVRLQQAGNDCQFRLSLTGTVVAIWNVDPDTAAPLLVDRLVYSHGTAAAFEPEGFWFDSNNSSSTLSETLNDISNKGWRSFVHPSIRSTLGAQLFAVLDKLDEIVIARHRHPFVRSLDVLFERSQAGDDFESEARDHAHFVYRVCLASAIIDRFDFRSAEGSLNGLRSFLLEQLGEADASSLTEPFYMVKKLRKQYPIHEEYELDGDGFRKRRKQLEDAESYFDLRKEPSSDWFKVRSTFVGALERLFAALSLASEEPV